MQSFNQRRWYILRADANALGGYLHEPIHRSIPTLAPVSLPAVGGFSTARSAAFAVDEIVSCASAYTRVSGEENADGSSSILVTAVVEDLNILEVVRAERVVTQVSISLPAEAGPLAISAVGSTYDGLRLGGQRCVPTLNPALQGARGEEGLLTWHDAQSVGQTQGRNLVQAFQGHSGEARRWVESRHRWMTSGAPAASGGYAQASLVDSVAVEVPGGSRCYGHIVEIPQFGRVILGELLVSHDSVQVVGIRAELGCPVKGRISSNAIGGGGLGEN